MGLAPILGIRGARDKPEDRYRGPAYSFFFGRSSSGKVVNERTAMQATAVYSCVRILGWGCEVRISGKWSVPAFMGVAL